jgi:hypothetical protein
MFLYHIDWKHFFQKRFSEKRFLVSMVQNALSYTDKKQGIIAFILILKEIPLCWRKGRRYVIKYFKKYREAKP